MADSGGDGDSSAAPSCGSTRARLTTARRLNQPRAQAPWQCLGYGLPGRPGRTAALHSSRVTSHWHLLLTMTAPAAGRRR